MELSASKTPRIKVVDALRGFAVMAIILVHNLEHFIFPVYPTEQPAGLAVLNSGGKERKRLRLPPLMATGSAAWLRDPERRFFPGRRRTVVICRSRLGFIHSPQME